MVSTRFFWRVFQIIVLITPTLVFSQIELLLNEKLTFESTIKFQKHKGENELLMEVAIPSIQLYPSESQGKNNKKFIELGHEKLQFLQNPGAPKVPYIATLVAAKPDELEVFLTKSNPYVINTGIIAPAQKEPCRCDTDKVEEFIFNKKEYSQAKNLVSLQYLGKYRGVPITRVLVKLASSNIEKKQTEIFSRIKVAIRSKKPLDTFHLSQSPSRVKNDLDYLIVGSADLTSGLSLWKTRKEALGFSFKVVNIEGEDALDANKLDAIFKSEYKKNKYQYALLVGDATKLGTNIVKTQWSAETQSDYGFFLMDGKRDIVPDVHYGRVVASSHAEVVYQANKWMNYELGQTLQKGQNRASSMIGIASNEGANPSDDEYVKSIESMLSSKYGSQIQHFYQDDPKSNPVDINQALNQGANWLTYLGHGDGKSWGSTNKSYSITYIKDLKNTKVSQPILIDVACQNGKLNKGHFGERMVNEGQKKNYFWTEGAATGSALYYGGSVNISWHPPAIMAKGMIEEQIKHSLQRIGDIILAGHLYLMNNYSDLNAVKENFAWYHLFGDPSTQVSF